MSNCHGGARLSGRATDLGEVGRVAEDHHITAERMGHD